jgi:hypothetical protein
MLRHTNGFVGLFSQTLMVIASGLTWAQTTSGAVHFYTTLRGIHVAGYQGWFACPGDGAVGVGWGHWFRGGSNPQDPNSLAIDLWPDTSELDADERCPTAFHLPSGAPAFLFSDQNAKTVASFRLDEAVRHRWRRHTTVRHGTRLRGSQTGISIPFLATRAPAPKRTDVASSSCTTFPACTATRHCRPSSRIGRI